MLQYIQPDDALVFSQRINILDNTVWRKLNGLDDAILIKHQLRQSGKIFVVDGITGLDGIFQQLGFCQITVELRLDVGHSGFRCVGSFELFLLDETAVQKGKHGKQQCEHQCEHAEGSVFDFFLRGWMFHIGYSLTVISCNGNYTTLYTSGEDFSR